MTLLEEVKQLTKDSIKKDESNSTQIFEQIVKKIKYIAKEGKNQIGLKSEDINQIAFDMLRAEGFKVELNVWINAYIVSWE